MSVRAFDWQAEYAKDERVAAMDRSCLTIRRYLKRPKREGNDSLSRDMAAPAAVRFAPGPKPALAETADQSNEMEAAAPSVEPAALAPIDSANQQSDVDMGLSDDMASTCHLHEPQTPGQDVEMEEGKVSAEELPFLVTATPSFEPLAPVSETATASQHEICAVTSTTTTTMVGPTPVVETDLPRPDTPSSASTHPSIAAQQRSSMATQEPPTPVGHAQRGRTEGSDQEDDENDEACHICKKDHDDNDSLLCDSCDEVYHTYCVGLFAVPKDDWFCPTCAPTHETACSRRAPEQMFEEIQEMDAMLVHACSCDAAACTHSKFSATCKPMKRALQCMSWLSFNAEIRAASFTEHLAKLLAFHAAHCAVGDACLVPLCKTLHVQGA